MPKKQKLNLRKTAKQNRAGVTLDTLLEASAQLFEKNGLLKTTTNRIAEVAGVSIGTLYQYFPNKESIIALLVDKRIDAELDHIRKRLGLLINEPLETAMREFIISLIKLYQPRSKLDSVLIASLGKVNRQRRLLDGQQEAAKMLRDFLADHPRRADYLTSDLDLATFILVQSVHSSIHAAVTLQPDLLQGKKLADELVALCIRYLIGKNN